MNRGEGLQRDIFNSSFSKQRLKKIALILNKKSTIDHFDDLHLKNLKTEMKRESQFLFFLNLLIHFTHLQGLNYF